MRIISGLILVLLLSSVVFGETILWGTDPAVTEVDPSTTIIITNTTQLDYGFELTTNAYIYKDFTAANYFNGDTVAYAKFRGYGGGDIGAWVSFLTFGGSTKALWDMDDANESYATVYGQPDNPDNLLYLRISDAGSISTDSMAYSANTTYYITLNYNDDGGAGGFGQWVLTVCSDDFDGTDIAGSPISVDVTGADKDYRYLYGVQSRNDDTGGAPAIVGWVNAISYTHSGVDVMAVKGGGVDIGIGVGGGL